MIKKSKMVLVRTFKSIIKFSLLLIRKPIWLIQRNNVPFSSYIQFSSKMRHCSLGKHCYISAFCGLNHVVMGNYCSIGPAVLLGNMEHDVSSISTSTKLSTNGNSQSVTTIGNDVWIGAQSFIKIGVKIGDGAVVGAQSFVNKDVPPYAIVVGTPAKILRYRFDEETIRKIRETEYWNKDPEEAKRLLAQINTN